MCGIIGYIGKNKAINVLINGLEKWNIGDMTLQVFVYIVKTK